MFNLVREQMYKQAHHHKLKVRQERFKYLGE